MYENIHVYLYKVRKIMDDCQSLATIVFVFLLSILSVQLATNTLSRKTKKLIGWKAEHILVV